MYMIFKKNNLQKFSYIKIVLIVSMCICQVSCKKYLDKKPSQNLAVPSNLSDLQAVLDNQVANETSPDYPEFLADNYFLTTSSWNTIGTDERNNYIWDKNAGLPVNHSEWSNPYRAIYYSNFVLDLLPKVSVKDNEQHIYNSIRGTALFYRAFMFNQLAQLFCKPYTSSASNDLGIVLKLTADVQSPIVRSTVEETYQQIISDLKTAAENLPETGLFPTRPNKGAAYGLLARVYLSMREYEKARISANTALSYNNTLLDYNLLVPAGNPNLPSNFIDNPEVLFASYSSNAVFDPSHLAEIDTLLYQSYNINDLRSKVFFGTNGTKHYWKGSYYSLNLSFTIFDGVSTDEIFLIRAECKARAGDKDSAMADLNTLLRKRWTTGTFTDLVANNAPEALSMVLTERRKELCFRGLRWTDLRRFNLEGANITLTRIINGNTYTLPPNDLRWVVQIPDFEITRSGIAQNPR